jgi:phosphatidate cytidylyltransferase
MNDASPKKSDLGVRTLSAIVMLAVAGSALWLGGWWWTAFAFLVGLGVLREWIALSSAFAGSALARLGWTVAGAVYCGLATTVLIVLRDGKGAAAVLVVLAAVIATDTGAYFAGRAIGGPKIAPRISPSKTWAGLGGGIVGASLVFAAWLFSDSGMANVRPPAVTALIAAGSGVAVAIVAQTGDFFESWMKRRAGVKDSGRLIPGHGGLFDRVDGLLAVLFVAGILALIAKLG